MWSADSRMPKLRSHRHLNSHRPEKVCGRSLHNSRHESKRPSVGVNSRYLSLELLSSPSEKTQRAVHVDWLGRVRFDRARGHCTRAFIYSPRREFGSRSIKFHIVLGGARSNLTWLRKNYHASHAPLRE